MLFKNPEGGERIWKQGGNIKLGTISVFLGSESNTCRTNVKA